MLFCSTYTRIHSLQNVVFMFHGSYWCFLDSLSRQLDVSDFASFIIDYFKLVNDMLLSICQLHAVRNVLLKLFLDISIDSVVK